MSELLRLIHIWDVMMVSIEFSSPIYNYSSAHLLPGKNPLTNYWGISNASNSTVPSATH